MGVHWGLRLAVCPGSFDPVTYGHLDIIERATGLFDHVIVAIAVNPGKTPLFTTEERLEMLKESIAGIPNVSATFFEGLLVEFAAAQRAAAIIKGLRATTDFEYEFQMALMNKRLRPEMETVFLMARNEFSYLSSSVVKDLVRFGGNTTGLVPPGVAERMLPRLQTGTAGAGGGHLK